MSAGDRALTNLPAPQPTALPGLPPSLYDWLNRLYDVLGGIESRLVIVEAGSAYALLLSYTGSESISGTASETAFSTSLVVTPEQWETGCVLRLRAGGVLSTTGEPTLALSVYLHTTALLSVSAVTVLSQTGSGVTDVPWELEADIACRVTGSSGVLMVNGRGFIAPAGLATALGNSAVVTPDLSVSRTLTLRGTWGTASTSNSLTLQRLTVERLPPPV